MNTPQLFTAAAAAACMVSSSILAQLPSVSPNAPALPNDSPVTATKSSTPVTTSPAAETGEPSEAEMMKMMMEMGKLNENHKLLAQLVGDWDYAVKMWMAPGQPPSESKGTATRKAEMGGRYFIANAKGQFQMPGADGKMQNVDFTGMSIDGYDNAKQKFVSAWIDSMGTGILMSEGTYDPATKTFTYQAEYEMAPGMKTKAQQTLKIADKDHHLMEWFEMRNGEAVKTMEISYTRKK
jgi:uncharacterized protein DUF1579